MKMIKNCLRFLMLTAGLMMMNATYAGTPLWTFAPVSGYPPAVTINVTETATVRYTVTNESNKQHTLRMKPLQGISSSGCTSTLKSHQSCILTLNVSGSALKGNVLGGPILCESANPNQCYQPSPTNSLAINLTSSPPIQQYTVTSSPGTNGSITPDDTQTVNSGSSLTFTATPDVNYTVGQWVVDGTPVQTGGTTYQLTNITANHNVNVTFVIQQYTVTASVGANGNISPSGTQTVNSGSSLTFTATPDVNYTVDQWVVDGTPVQTGGTTYQLTNINANHNVNVTFVIQQYTVTASAGANGNVSPIGAQIVNSGSSLTFTAIPNTGYAVEQWLVDGNIVQTGGTSFQLTNITANLTVNVTFGTVTLTPSLLTLGLSINCLPSSSTCTNLKNSALTGNPRQITIQNNGSINATNLAVSASNLPAETSISGNTCTGTLNAGASCDITITPGSIANSNTSNIACTSGNVPAASVVTVSADGGLSVSIDIYVLGYGCIYQGGFIYSIDDTTSTTVSVGGKVVAITDTVPGSINPPTGTPDWGGVGVDIGSSLYETDPQGANDGSANTAEIISALTTNYSSPPYSGSSPVPLSDYAAGLCSTLSVDASGNGACISPTICYTNWFLPAICELGNATVGCTTTNILTQLFVNTRIPSATLGFVNGGIYWSSTEDSTDGAFSAYITLFNTAGSSIFSLTKDARSGVRCSRALTS